MVALHRWLFARFLVAVLPLNRADGVLNTGCVGGRTALLSGKRRTTSRLKKGCGRRSTRAVHAGCGLGQCAVMDMGRSQCGTSRRPFTDLATSSITGRFLREWWLCIRAIRPCVSTRIICLSGLARIILLIRREKVAGQEVRGTGRQNSQRIRLLLCVSNMLGAESRRNNSLRSMGLATRWLASSLRGGTGSTSSRFARAAVA